MPPFSAVNPAEASEIREYVKLLVVTATPVETKALHKAMRPLSSFAARLAMCSGTQTYHIGQLGSVGVIHVECQIGSVAPGASLVTVLEAITFWQPTGILMVGIAFGMHPTEQRIGDVIISKTVRPYEMQRVGSKQIINRSPAPNAGPTLLNRFTACRDWKFALSDGRQATAKPGELLSGEKLIDNITFRKRLQKTFPEAVGGEMEGAGLYTAAHEKQVQWIIVKGICDFADGKKRHDKKAKQALAAQSAVSYCVHVLSQKGCLDSLGCVDTSIRRQPSTQLDTNAILFDIYESRLELAYLKRALDSQISQSISHEGLWLWGRSGTGKTTLLRRAVVLHKKRCFSIDLSKCVGDSLNQIFAALYSDIAEVLNEPTIATAKGQSYWIKAISKAIKRSVTEHTYFFIDEIPLSDATDFQSFSDGITAIIISLANANVQTATFLLASIANPTAYLQEFQQKVHQHIRFIEIPKWDDTDIGKLLDKLTLMLKLKMTKGERSKIIQLASGCPRQLKQILRAVTRRSNIARLNLDNILCNAHL